MEYLILEFLNYTLIYFKQYFRRIISHFPFSFNIPINQTFLSIRISLQLGDTIFLHCFFSTPNSNISSKRRKSRMSTIFFAFLSLPCSITVNLKARSRHQTSISPTFCAGWSLAVSNQPSQLAGRRKTNLKLQVKAFLYGFRVNVWCC